MLGNRLDLSAVTSTRLPTRYRSRSIRNFNASFTCLQMTPTNGSRSIATPDAYVCIEIRVYSWTHVQLRAKERFVDLASRDFRENCLVIREYSASNCIKALSVCARYRYQPNPPLIHYVAVDFDVASRRVALRRFDLISELCPAISNLYRCRCPLSARLSRIPRSSWQRSLTRYGAKRPFHVLRFKSH